MKTFCPSCEKETNCVYIAELYECKECGCDFESKQRQMQERLDAAIARAEAAEARAERLQAALADIAHGPVGTWNEPQHAAEVIKHMMRVASDALKGGEG